MMSGNKCMAIFGFCDIHHFAEVNEVLDIEIMVFVNTIADVVHFAVDKFAGSTNKNIGEAFLLVWKFHADDIKKTPKTLELKAKSKHKNHVAD